LPFGKRAAVPLEKPARFDDRRVLDLRRYYVIALVTKRKEDALNSKVVGLAAAARENNLVILAIPFRT
jgi:hypothetical protein